MKKQDYKTLELPPKYKPTKKEQYMCPEQLAYFYQMLINKRAEILDDTDNVLQNIQSYKSNGEGSGDVIDNAQNETEALSELRFRDRDSKLLKLIDAALKRMENGTYGYCTITGEEIGIDRLMARPMTTMTIEAQEEYELNKKRNCQ